MRRSLETLLSPGRGGRQRRTARGAVAPSILAAAAALACGDSDRVEIRQSAETSGPAAELSAAIERAAEREASSPSAYREFSRAVEKLRPFDSRALERRAELKVSFFALPRLEAVAEAPLEERVEALALTVWPTALEVEPEDGESPRAYLERACKTDLARRCKRVVPRYRPLVVSDYVWRRFKSRALSALRACRDCPEERYEEALKTYHARQSELSAKRAEVGDRLEPSSWPRAAGGARAYPEDAPLLTIDPDGRATLRGERIDEPPGWRGAIRDAEGPAEVLGVHLRPSASVALLREVLRAAARAGYRDVALAAVAPDYPYAHKAYILAARERERARRVQVRDTDTVQVLVQRLGAALESEDERIRL